MSFFVLIRCIVFIGALCLSSGSEVAWAYKVGGIISGGGAPLANISVSLYDASTSGEARGSVLTDTEGRYLFGSVSNGTYKLFVSSPDKTLFSDSWIVDPPIVVSGADLTRDVALPKKSSTMTGTVRTPSGEVVTDVTVCAYNSATYSNLCAKSGPAGVYSIDGLESGSYRIDISGGAYYGGSANVPLPFGFSIISYLSGVAVSANLTQDVTLPLVTLSGRTTDSNGAAVAGVVINVPNQNWDVNGVGYSCRNDAASYGSNHPSAIVSDSQGKYQVTLLSHGRYHVTLTPPGGKDVLETSLSPFAATATATRDIPLDTVYRISGAVRTPSGEGVSNITVCAFRFSTYQNHCTKSDAAGGYSITGLAPASYRIDISGGTHSGEPSNIPLPSAFSITSYLSGISVSGNQTRNITLPLVTLKGKTTDPDGKPVGGVAISVPVQSWNVNGVEYSCRDDATYYTSDSSGNYSLTLLAYGNYRVTLTPPSGQGVLQTSLSPVDATATAGKDLRLNNAYRMSGSVLSASGEAVSNITVCAYSPAFVNFCTKSDANGWYSISGLEAGSYRVDIYGGEVYGDRANIPLPYGFSITSYLSGLAVSADLKRDIVLPLATLTGKISDLNGLPMGGVALAVPVQSWNINGVGYTCRNDASEYGRNHPAAVVSDAAGNYRMTLLAYSGYFMSVNPPAGAGFAPAHIGPRSVTTSTVQNITLTKYSPQYALSVTVAGKGSVTSSPDGINCSTGTCGWIYDWETPVTLTATPLPGGTFTGWSGACQGNGPCAVTMDAVKDVTATFASAYALEMRTSGTGTGDVNSDPAPLLCSGTLCYFQPGTAVTLLATAHRDSIFGGWQGACTNAEGNCSVTLNDAASVSAIFTLVPPVKLRGNSETLHPNLQQAYDASLSGDSILSREGEFPETLLFSRPVTVFLHGGYDPGYSGKGKGMTRVKGTLRVRSGTLKVENLVIY